MPATDQVTLQPRKTPVQARSTASVDALLEATLQVLVAVGKEQLTTTKVAERAGVSVGTLYQYFPNKSSLLQATLRRHFAGVVEAVEHVCRQERGKRLTDQSAALAEAFLAAKLKDGKSSVALYAVSEDVDGRAIALQTKGRTHAAIQDMLETASDISVANAEMVATVLQGIMAGVSRQLLESASPREQFPAFLRELQSVMGAYVGSCASRQAR